MNQNNNQLSDLDKARQAILNRLKEIEERDKAAQNKLEPTEEAKTETLVAEVQQEKPVEVETPIVEIKQEEIVETVTSDVETPKEEVIEVETPIAEIKQEEIVETVTSEIKTPKEEIIEVEAPVAEIKQEEIVETVTSEIETPKEEIIEVETPIVKIKQEEIVETVATDVETPKEEVFEIEVPVAEIKQEEIVETVTSEIETPIEEVIEVETPIAEIKQEEIVETVDTEIEEEEKEPKANKKDIAELKAEATKIKDKEKFERKSRTRARENEQLKRFAISVSNRTKGKIPADPGNKHVKHTYCEVFVFVVDDNKLQLKVLQEQFKNTRSFKKTVGFTNGADLLEYIKTRKFPKMSILLVVMDYFLEDSDDAEAQNGITVLNELKDYDPNIEVIMLSSSTDADIATSASYFGAVTFIQKGKDAFKKVLNNMVWAIHEQEKIRKKSDTKKMIKFLLIGFVSLIVLMLIIDSFTGILGILPDFSEIKEVKK